MITEPNTGALVLNDAVAARAALAREMAIAITASALTGFLDLFIDHRPGKDWDVDEWAVIGWG